jgi:DNA-binding MarR family transcriptional regulator
MNERDRIDERRAQWATELPTVNTIGMAILGRARWLTLQVRPAIESVFTRAGFDSGEFDVLSTLLRSGTPYRLRPTELYRSLMISSGGLTNRLDRLERAGLIRRVQQAGDARSLPVELTREGRRRAEVAFREDMKLEAAMVSVLSADERRLLGALLRKLVLAVEATDTTIGAAGSTSGEVR